MGLQKLRRRTGDKNFGNLIPMRQKAKGVEFVQEALRREARCQTEFPRGALRQEARFQIELSYLRR